MWADAQRDDRPAEYKWRPLRKFCNAIGCTTPQSLVDARCWSAGRAVTLPYENARLGRKVIFAPGKIPSEGKSPRKCIYSVTAQETAKHPAKFGWSPLSDVAAVTKARRETC